MYVAPHVKSDISDNKGSCSRYANYLLKYNTHFFSHTRADITYEQAVDMIDKHNGRGIGKNDDKWFAPIYNLSEEEAQYLAYSLFGKHYKDYEELSQEEKIIWNEKIIEIGRELQNVMAKNFNREELGIRDGNDLMYIGVVENERKYRGTDEEVKKGLAKSGERKRGFNTHIHIIQCRRANNEKKSKISPMANERRVRENNFGKKVGFDRGEFVVKCFDKFDEITGYKRKLEESFDYKNELKKGSPFSKEELKKLLGKRENDIGVPIDRKRKRIKTKNKFVSKKEIQEIRKKFSTLDYFLELQEKGLLIFEGEKNGKYVFREYFKEKSTIFLNKKEFWEDSESKEKGSIIEATIKFEQCKNWLEGALLLKEKLGEYMYAQQQMSNENKKIIQERDVVFKNYFEYYEKQGVPGKLVKKHLTQVRYTLPNGKICYGMGMKNNSGGYELSNGKYTSKVGKSDITQVTYENENKNVLIFNFTQDYLEYLSKQKVDKTREDVIILNEHKNWEKANSLIQEKKYEKIVYVSSQENFEENYQEIKTKNMEFLNLDVMKKRKPNI